MARYFLDTEFSEYPYSIIPISIGIVCDDGREYYAQNSSADLSHVNKWVRANVLPQLKSYGDPCWKSLGDIRKDLQAFFKDDEKPEIWGWYADYDWVVFCWTIAGPMSALPQNMPRYCRDLKQEADITGLTKEELAFPPDPEGEHNALIDARWNKAVFERLREVMDDNS